MSQATVSTAAANPFIGPRSFETGERLYGRDRELRSLYSQLVAERIVLLHSPSGAGKTSLVQAALIPKLVEEGFHVWPPIRVGWEPEAPRAEASAAPNRHVQSALRSLEKGLPADRASGLGSLEGLDVPGFFAGWQSNGEAVDHVLLFDQFEEILTVAPNEIAAKQAFFEQIGVLLRSPHVFAVFSIRDEYVGALEPFRRLIPRALETRFRLDLLGEKAAREAIVTPARESGVEITEAAATVLVDNLRTARVRRGGRIVEEPGPYVEPVQLQVVCLRLWEAHRGSERIHSQDVEGLGGDVDAALSDYYAERLRAVAVATGVPERSLRDWLEDRLITPQGTRGQVQAGDPTDQGLSEAAINGLIDARLVRAEERRSATWFELAHDRLIEPVRADNLRWRDAALEPWQRKAILWAQGNEPAGLLLRGRELFKAERQLRRPDTPLTKTERRFLATSQAATRRRLVIYALVLAFAAIVAVLLWINVKARKTAVEAKAKAENTLHALQENTAEFLLEQALSYCERGDVARGFMLLARSLKAAPADDAAIRRSVLTQFPAWLPSLNRMRDVKYEPAGYRIPYGNLNAGTDRLTLDHALKARIAGAYRGRDADAFLRSLGPVWAAAEGADGHRVLVSTRVESVGIHDTATGRVVRPFPTEIMKADSRRFSPDGRFLMAFSD